MTTIKRPAVIATVTLTYRYGRAWTIPVRAYPERDGSYRVTLAGETSRGVTAQEALHNVIEHIRNDFSTPPDITINEEAA